MSANNNWWNEVAAIIEEKSLLKHPFYQAWTEGRLTSGDLAHYARQYYQQESRFPRYVSAVHSNCPDLKTRQMLLQNLNHEEAGTENHPELWMRFAESVGASRESVSSAAAAPETVSCVDTFDKLSRDENWVKGMAALYAYEAQQPEVAKTKIEGLKKWYNVNAESALGFFKVHQDVDVWHSESEKQILLAEAEKNSGIKVEVKAAVSAACDALNDLLTGVCQARGIVCRMN